MLRRIRDVFAATRKHKEDGKEYPDPRPIEIPAGMRRPESLQSMIARLVQQEDFKRKIREAGGETEDEANDFDIDGDDPEDVFSEHEQIAHAMMEDEDVRAGKAAAAARASRGDRRGGEDSRGEDDARGRKSRGVRRYESETDDDADERRLARRGESDSESDGRRYQRREDVRERGE